MRYSTYNAIPHNPKSKKHPYETLEKPRFSNKKRNHIFVIPLEATTRFELVIRVLQTHALPLGYVAMMTPTRFELVLPP